MKMKYIKLVVVLFVGFIAGNLWAAPFPIFKSPGPGLNLPFEVDGSVDTYGGESHLSQWSFDGWSGETLSPEFSLARFYTTLEGEIVPIDPNDPNDLSNMTAMPMDEDWVFRVQYNHTGSWYAVYAPIKLYHRDPCDPDIEYKIFAVNSMTSGNTIAFRVGNAANVWDTTSGGVYDLTPWAEIVVHYIAEGPVLYIYYNGERVQQATVGHGRYDVSWLEFNSVGLGEDSFRKITISQYEDRPVPEQLYFVAGQPGLSVPFAADDVPDVYGRKDSASGWTFDGDWGSSSDVAEATYRTTLDNDNSNVTAMSDANDWYLEFTYDHNDVDTVESSVFMVDYEQGLG